MAIKIKDIRHKHQVKAQELIAIEDKAEREAAFEEFSIGLVAQWDYTGEDGQVLPLEPASFPELKIEDIEEMSDAINAVLFPPKVKKTNGDKSPSGSTPVKPARPAKEKSLNGFKTSSLAVGQE